MFAEYGRVFGRDAHQGLGNDLIAPTPATGSITGNVVETERLGGLLRSYRRAAA